MTVPERLYGPEGAEELASDMDEYIDDNLWKLIDPDWPDSFTFVEYSVFHPSHHLPSRDILLDWVNEWAAENGEVVEGWELGGGDEDNAAADAFIAALADNVSFGMADQVLAEHLVELVGRQPMLDGVPYGEPLEDLDVGPVVEHPMVLEAKRMVCGVPIDVVIEQAVRP